MGFEEGEVEKFDPSIFQQSTFAPRRSGGKTRFVQVESIKGKPIGLPQTESAKGDRHVNLLSGKVLKFEWVPEAFRRTLEAYRQAGYEVDPDALIERLSHIKPGEMYFATRAMKLGFGLTFTTPPGAGGCNGATREVTLSGTHFVDHPSCDSNCDGEPALAKKLRGEPVSNERLANFHRVHGMSDPNIPIDSRQLSDLKVMAGGYGPQDIGRIIENPEGQNNCRCQYEVRRVGNPYGVGSIMAVRFNICGRHRGE